MVCALVARRLWEIVVRLLLLPPKGMSRFSTALASSEAHLHTVLLSCLRFVWNFSQQIDDLKTKFEGILWSEGGAGARDEAGRLLPARVR